MATSSDSARDQRLDQLRRQLAAVSGGTAVSGGNSASVGRAALPGRGPRPTLSVPAALAALLPYGGLIRGEVLSYSGAEVLLVGVLAAVTGAGKHAAVIGRPRFGVLAAVEMGARLDRLAVVPDPGADPVEIASILLDGLDLVVLGLGGRAVSPSRARVLTARARSKGAVLLVTDGAWGGPVLRVAARLVGTTGLGSGSGRVRELQLEVSVAGRSAPSRQARLTLAERDDRMEWVAGDECGPHAVSREGHTLSSSEVVGY